jgi:chemotaxis protein MotD
VPPTQQIADRIIAEAPTLIPAARGAAGPAQPGMKPAIKVLQIELQPADLGTVSVRMELKDTGLRLHVEADRSKTADLIRGDEDTLSKLLRSAGYDINPASIRVVDGDRSVTPAQAGQQGAQTGLQASTQSQSGWSGRQERPQHGNANPNGGDAQIANSRNDGHEATKTRTGDDLYI